MAYTFETKTELRRALQGVRIQRVDFGGSGLLSDERSITLRMDGGDHIEISATPYGALKIEAI
jgi:hypothetical protein